MALIQPVASTPKKGENNAKKYPVRVSYGGSYGYSHNGKPAMDEVDSVLKGGNEGKNDMIQGTKMSVT